MIENGDPAFQVCEEIFHTYHVPEVERVAAIHAIREAVARCVARCISVCDSDGRCSCAKQIADYMGVGP